jgi:hypothetical protein
MEGVGQTISFQLGLHPLKLARLSSITDKGRDERTGKEKSEELQEVCQILRKNETRWTSAEYNNLLRWKMWGGRSVYKSKPERMKKWQEILDGLTEEGEVEIASLSLPDVKVEVSD